MKDYEIYNGVMLSGIRPAVDGKSDKYSWNVFRWVRAWCRDRAPNLQAVTFPKDGSCPGERHPGGIYLGYYLPEEPGWFIGARLAPICADPFPKGRDRLPRNIGANPVKSIEDITDWFWPTYAAIGRCALWDHEMPLIGDEERFHQHSGDTRTCNWCGLTEGRVSVTRKIVEHRWRPVTSEEAA